MEQKQKERIDRLLSPPQQPSKPPAFTITKEADAMLEDIKARSLGKDARKARLLTITARALLTKLAEVSPGVRLLIQGREERKGVNSVMTMRSL